MSERFAIKLDTEMLPDINDKQQLKPIKRVGRKKSPYIFNFEKYKEIIDLELAQNEVQASSSIQ